jgi:Fusaric acid resistance protein-like
MIAWVHAPKLDPFAFKSALRAAIVMPLAFALSLVVIDDGQMALFAAFGSVALLVFVDFSGSRRARLDAYLILVAVGALLIAVGTLCSHTTWLAAAVMGLVAFAILFGGVLSDYVAAARAGAMLTFVLPVMVQADAAAIPSRLAGWGLAAALAIPATLLLWPARARSAVRHEAAQAARAMAELVDARRQSGESAVEAAAQAAHTAVVAVRDRFVSVALRPSGTAGPTAALARLIDDLGWLQRAAVRVPALPSGDAPCPSERAEIEAAAAAALRDVAARLDGSAADATVDLERLRTADEIYGRAQLAHFRQLQPDRDEAEATAELDEAYRLRVLAFGTLQAGRDGLQASGDRVPGASRETPVVKFRAARRLGRAHASLSSVWLRNSVRGAVGLALAVLIGRLTDLQHAFWIVLGTLSVLRSSALSTGATIASALLGTLAGIVVGGLIVLAVGSSNGALWAVLPFAVLLAGYAPQAISFAAGQASFTLVVLVLFNLIQPVGWKVGLVRVEDVAIGTAVSLLVGVLLWPHGATALLRSSLGAAYVASANYLDATITALLGRGEAAQLPRAAREAFDTAQLLDTAVRDYLANRGSGRGRLHDLTVLTAGANRVRRVGGLLQDARSFSRLAPDGGGLPGVMQARDAFDAERHALCDWYAALGRSISERTPAPAPEQNGNAAGLTRTSRTVVLEHSRGAADLQPGLAIAWAQRYLDVLAEFEPVLASTYGRIVDGGGADVERRST